MLPSESSKNKASTTTLSSLRTASLASEASASEAGARRDPGSSGWWASPRHGGSGGGGPRLGGGRLERVEDVEGALADLAGDGQGGGVRAGVPVVAAIELMVGAVLAAVGRPRQAPSEASAGPA